MYLKTNLETPAQFDTLTIELSAVCHWDATPTTLRMQLACMDDTGAVLHTIADTTAMYYHYSPAWATTRNIRYNLKILNKIGKPKRIVIVLNNLYAYLTMTRQIVPLHINMAAWAKICRTICRKLGVPVVFRLGDYTALRELETNVNERAAAHTAPATLEGNGIRFKEYMDRQRTIRVENKIWKS